RAAPLVDRVDEPAGALHPVLQELPRVVGLPVARALALLRREVVPHLLVVAVDAEFGGVAAVERDDELAVDELDGEVRGDVVRALGEVALAGFRVEALDDVEGLLELLLADREL